VRLSVRDVEEKPIILQYSLNLIESATLMCIDVDPGNVLTSLM
jgi:hypothetical protein